MPQSAQAYVVEKFVSLEGVKLQMSWLPIKHQGFAAGVNHQISLDAFSCKQRGKNDDTFKLQNKGWTRKSVR